MEAGLGGRAAGDDGPNDDATARDVSHRHPEVGGLRRRASREELLGHRADLVISRTAQTICAWREAEALVDAGATDAVSGMDSLAVSSADVVAAAELALAHRRREHSSADSSGTPSPAESARDRMEEMRRSAEASCGSSAPVVTRPSVWMPAAWATAATVAASQPAG